MVRIDGCRVDDRGWECDAGLENVESVLRSRGFRRLADPAAQETVGQIANEHASDAGFCERLTDFLESEEFTGLGSWQRGEVLRGVTRFSDESALDRLQHLSGDDFFRSSPSEREVRRQVEAAATNNAPVSPDALLESSGAATPPRSRPGIVTGISLVAHATEALGESVAAFAEGQVLRAGAHATVAHGVAAIAEPVATIAGYVALPIVAYEAVHGIHEAHEQGPVLGAQVQFGRGFVREFERLMGGRPGAQHSELVGDSAGVVRAREVWGDLEPAQRAQLLAMNEGERRAFVTELGVLVEQRTHEGR